MELFPLSAEVLLSHSQSSAIPKYSADLPGFEIQCIINGKKKMLKLGKKSIHIIFYKLHSLSFSF